MQGRCSTFASLIAGLMLFLLPLFAHATKPGNALDIQAELARPGVKLVVVEFYATWCVPCMEAVPKWKALHEKYKKHGLRFIVVSADEDVCAKPPDWSPDATFCDTGGVLQRRYEVSDLPTSLLFSWEGNVALRSHRVKPVERAIESYFRDMTYKIDVDEPEVIGDKYAIGSNPDWVRDDVVARLQARSKFDVVTSSAERLPWRKSDHCSTEFPPNSVLRLKLTGDESGERYLTLRLEKDGCVKASSQEVYKGQGFREDKASLRQAAHTAVDKLLAQVVTVRTPEDADSGVRVRTFRNRFDDDGSAIKNPIVDEKGYLGVESVPEGATVYVNGDEMGTTPFVKELMVGEYVVLVKSGALWIPARKRVKLTREGTRLHMELGPNYGELKVTSHPEGAEIWIDGEPSGRTTPYTFPMKKAGEYNVVLKKKLYLNRTISVQLGHGRTTEIDQRLEPNFGSIHVTSTPPGARILIDGKDSGETTPATVSPVAVGGREVTVRLASHNDYKKFMDVELGETVEFDAKLTGIMGLLKVEAFEEKNGKKQPMLGAEVLLDGKVVGKTPLKEPYFIGIHTIEISKGDLFFEDKIRIKQEGDTFHLEAVLTNNSSLRKKKRDASMDSKDKESHLQRYSENILKKEEGLSGDRKTYTDRTAALMWQAERNVVKMNQNSAIEYCKNLDFDGHSDWYLPNVEELRTLRKISIQEQILERKVRSGLELEKKRFCHLPYKLKPYLKSNCGPYWSSDYQVDEEQISQYTLVDFTDGQNYNMPQQVLANVRCVRVNDRYLYLEALNSKVFRSTKGCHNVSKTSNFLLFFILLQMIYLRRKVCT